MPLAHKSVLVVDDEPSVRDLLHRWLAEAGSEVRTAGSGLEALEAVANRVPDLVVMDQRMPGLTGLETSRTMASQHSRPRFVLMTGFPLQPNEIDLALGLGFLGFLEKPFRQREFLTRIVDILTRSSVAEKALTEDMTVRGIVGRSSQIARVAGDIKVFAAHPDPVLITGETGTGKELVAKAIHDLSPRRGGPFIPYNCAAGPIDLFDASLFGHEAGAFTGAREQRKGLLEAADGGTLLLDEFALLTLEAQGKLLRFLEDNSYTRLGSHQLLRSDARIIVATNVELEALVRDGRFREDLLYRVRVLRIHLPPLRERDGDIADLLDYFLQTEARRRWNCAASLLPEARHRLLEYGWPGNVRELKHAVVGAVVRSQGKPIGLEHLPPEVGASQRFDATLPVDTFERRAASVAAFAHTRSLRELESEYQDQEQRILEATLEAHRYNHAATARSLGMSVRHLRRKLKRR